MSVEVEKVQATILRLIQAYIRSKKLGIEVGLTSDLVEIGLTSFDMVQVVLSIENEYHLKFPDEELSPRNFGSAVSIARVTRELLSRA